MKLLPLCEVFIIVLNRKMYFEGQNVILKKE